jgi:hypothetical protein
VRCAAVPSFSFPRSFFRCSQITKQNKNAKPFIGHQPGRGPQPARSPQQRVRVWGMARRGRRTSNLQNTARNPSPNRGARAELTASASIRSNQRRCSSVGPSAGSPLSPSSFKPLHRVKGFRCDGRPGPDATGVWPVRRQRRCVRVGCSSSSSRCGRNGGRQHRIHPPYLLSGS